MSADDQDRTYPARLGGDPPVNSTDRAVARAEGYSISQGKPGGAATTRMRKVECTMCGYNFRISRRWIMVGLPDCPTCGIPLECRDLHDALCDPARSEHLTAAYGDRELAKERREKGSRRLGIQARCETCACWKTNPKEQCMRCGYWPGHGYVPLPGGGRWDDPDAGKPAMPF